MKNSINVYWGTFSYLSPSYPLLATPPDPVISSFSKKVKGKEGYNEYIKCPAFSNEFKNTFVYKSLIDFKIDINPQTLNIIPDPNVEIRTRNLNEKLFEANLPTIFFSDESLEMSQIPSSLHFNNFSENSNLFSGKYDIGKWFRPLSLDFRLKTPFIQVKKEDALFYLKFHTDKKIKFINFDITDEIIKIQNSCLSLKYLRSGYRFNDLYNFFLRVGYRKKLLKEIKSNLTGY